jgi:hypothetical protein
MAHHLSAEMQRCIDACRECERICLETIAYCLTKGGQHVTPDHLGTLGVCADICATSARAMTVGSPVHAYVCQACASVCDRCAESCERIGQDEIMKKCADVCRRCAESCRKMAQAAA